MTVDPGWIDQLKSKFDKEEFRSRQVELPTQEDTHEAMFERSWTDGLPVVPPTPQRVRRMLEGTSRDADEIVVLVPPNLVECTVEKIAVNAVMAGCKPEFLPVVIAALEAICTEEFNMHGVLATTMSVGPIFVVNGPIADEIGMNSEINVLGHGNRANSTIGRAVQLVILNVGGGGPGGVDRSTFGHMGKQGFCFSENEVSSPWPSVAETRGFEPSQNVVTAFTGEGPRLVVDQKSRTPESLTLNLAAHLISTVSSRMVAGMDAMLVLSPEHSSRYEQAGWSKERFLEEITSMMMVDTDSIIAGAGGIEEGLPEAFRGVQLPKFRPNGLIIAQAGGPAGLFSAIIGGWLNGPTGSEPTSKEILF